MMSAASSGGVLSSVDLIASMICVTGSSSACRTSSLERITVFGSPVSMSRPRTSACTSSFSGCAEPTSSLISSAVCWPISSLYSRLMWLMIASSISSPPTRSDCETTIPPSEMTATSVVPPPMSTIMFPVGSATGSPAPIAAAIGFSIKYAWRAPADSVASSTARFSTPVTPLGTQTTTRGCAKRCWCTFWMKWRSICSVTSKSAMTPSLSGRIAEIVPGVRPSMRFASTPTACTSPVRWSIATTEGSERTMPRPRTYTSVFAVPRSTAMSRPPKPPRLSKSPIKRASLVQWGSTEAVHAGEALREQPYEQRGRQAHDVQVVTLDATDERGAAALDRVAPRSPLPLAERDIGAELPRGQLSELHPSRLVLDVLPGGCEQAEPRDDEMRFAAELLEHALCLGGVCRLAEDPAVEHDGGIDAEHRTILRDVRNGPRLLAGVRTHDLDCIGDLRIAFFVVRRDDIERNVQLLEDGSSLRRRRREQQGRRRRRISHACSRSRSPRAAIGAPTRP